LFGWLKKVKIAIVSDTHGNVANFRKAIEWMKKENIRTILHAGDIGNPESLRESLEGFGGLPLTNFSDGHGSTKVRSEVPSAVNNKNIKSSLKLVRGKFFGVLGNMDKDFKIGISEYLKIPGVKIAEKIFELTINGQAAPLTNSHELVNAKKVAVTHLPNVAKELAQSGKYDLVFYGHTHKPWQEKFLVSSGLTRNCWLVNPGELAGQLYKPTFAVYDIDTGNLELKILEKL